jgi:hypothetical protein
MRKSRLGKGLHCHPFERSPQAGTRASEVGETLAGRLWLADVEVEQRVSPLRKVRRLRSNDDLGWVSVDRE